MTVRSPPGFFHNPVKPRSQFVIYLGFIAWWNARQRRDETDVNQSGKLTNLRCRDRTASMLNAHGIPRPAKMFRWFLCPMVAVESWMCKKLFFPMSNPENTFQ